MQDLADLWVPGERMDLNKEFVDRVQELDREMQLQLMEELDGMQLNRNLTRVRLPTSPPAGVFQKVQISRRTRLPRQRSPCRNGRRRRPG